MAISNSYVKHQRVNDVCFTAKKNGRSSGPSLGGNSGLIGDFWEKSVKIIGTMENIPFLGRWKTKKKLRPSSGIWIYPHQVEYEFTPNLQQNRQNIPNAALRIPTFVEYLELLPVKSHEFVGYPPPSLADIPNMTFSKKVLGNCPYLHGSMLYIII